VVPSAFWEHIVFTANK